jgi:hypothetical protein
MTAFGAELALVGVGLVALAVVMARRHPMGDDTTLSARARRRETVTRLGIVTAGVGGLVYLLLAGLVLATSTPASASTLSHHAPATHHAPARHAPLGPGRIVGLALAPGNTGYWEVSSTGVVYAFGSANFYGDLVTAHVRPPLPVVGIVPTNDGRGYYLVDSAHSMVWPFGLAALYPAVPSIPVAPPSGGSSPIAPLVGVVLLLAAGGFVGRWAWRRFHIAPRSPRLSIGAAADATRRMASTIAPSARPTSARPTAARASAPAPPVDDDTEPGWEWDS